jgi:papain like cysteine protease AvrRpt2
MAVLLNVPFVDRSGASGSPAGAHYDAPGCWYACVSMVARHFRLAPQTAFPQLLKRDLGGGVLGSQATGHGPVNLAANDHEALAQLESLDPVARCGTLHDYSLIELEDRLRTRGPIFYYWMKQGAAGRHGHAAVMIGTDATGIIYHDPEQAPHAKMTVGAFNASRQRWRSALMQRL